MERVRVTAIDDPVTLGRRLREVRRERGLTLRELGFPGCTSAYLSSIEHGRRVPSLQVLTVLAERLSVSVEFLSTGRAVGVTALLDDAELALRLGEIDQAETLFGAIEEPIDGNARLRRLGGLGVVAVHRGDLEEGIRLLEESRAAENDRFLDLTSLVEALGRSYANRGEYESAIALFGAARDRSVARADRTTSLKLSVLLANTYIDLGDLARSNETLALALRDSDELRDPRLRANVYWTQARLHTTEGRHDLAADFAERALETLRVNEDERAIAFAHQTLAYIELERGDPAHALELLDLVAPTIDATAETMERAVFQLERARAFAALGQSEQALELLQEIGPILRDGSKADSARYAISLGALYEHLDFLDDALQMYDSAIIGVVGHRNPYLVRALRLKSELLERLGRADEALATLREAVRAQDGGEAVTKVVSSRKEF